MRDLANLIEALRSYEQADEEGVMVLVSRQACEEAAGELERSIRQVERQAIDPFTRIEVTLMDSDDALKLIGELLDASHDYEYAVDHAGGRKRSVALNRLNRARGAVLKAMTTADGRSAKPAVTSTDGSGA